MNNDNNELYKTMYPPEVKHADLPIFNLTRAELHFNQLVESRRKKGRETYGQGLQHTDSYNWNMMALEEAMDLAQYLAAQNLRLTEALRKLGQHSPMCAQVVQQDDCNCGLFQALHGT